MGRERGRPIRVLRPFWQMRQQQHIDKWTTAVGIHILFDSCFETKIKLCIDKSSFASTENVAIQLNWNYLMLRVTKRVYFHYTYL